MARRVKIGGKGLEKPKNPFKTAVRIFGYMGSFKLLMVMVVVLIAFTSLARVVGTAFLKIVTDNYIIPLANNYDNQLFLKFVETLIIMAIIYFVGVVSNFVYNRIMVTVASMTLYKIRVDLFKKMEKLPISYFDTHTHGDLMSLYTNDIDAIREMLSESISSIILSTVSFTSVFLMMLYYSWQLSLIVIFMLFIMLFVVKKITTKTGKYFTEQQQELGKTNGFIEEMIAGQKVVKVFNHEEKSETDFEALNDKLRLVATHANAYANILMPIMVNLSNINYALVSMIGGFLILQGILTLGTVVAFLQFTRSFVHPIGEISSQYNSILTAIAGAERIFKVIDEQPEVDEGTVTLENANGKLMWKDENNYYTELKGDIEFKDVVFMYDGKKVVLDDIDLKASDGQKIALVGSTGAGKTTVTNLINRFYDVSEGSVTFDGIDVRKIKKDDLRKSIAVVLQDTHLFTETVKENIRYGDLNATNEEIIAAAKMANADSFIRHLPQGYDTVLSGDGSNLSQGEKQLLTIARAIIADPPVLILDEATSSIDTRTEKLIEKGMDTLMKGRTVFVIAHRLSTVRDADSIIVLENGGIIEQGNHNELIDDRGRYYQLYNGMFELI